MNNFCSRTKFISVAKDCFIDQCNLRKLWFPYNYFYYYYYFSIIIVLLSLILLLSTIICQLFHQIKCLVQGCFFRSGVAYRKIDVEICQFEFWKLKLTSLGFNYNKLFVKFSVAFVCFKLCPSFSLEHIVGLSLFLMFVYYFHGFWC